ncbi:hypothetical protein RHGRI_000452 [Rhododendron griersonianum]|uniref:Uncharacterized protein n=1 Tax=Rhododendron griersonianum TaxID=479676 RepID=A0AAV6LGL0_9ERIC|nr:hypothetical protein RHGRI_000452 [Rhododendron griersonianum]
MQLCSLLINDISFDHVGTQLFQPKGQHLPWRMLVSLSPRWISLLVFQKFTITGTFDVVVVNLYPFYDKVSSAGGIAFEDGFENIDIGGPAMIRAAAKVQKLIAASPELLLQSELHLDWKLRMLKPVLNHGFYIPLPPKKAFMLVSTLPSQSIAGVYPSQSAHFASDNHNDVLVVVDSKDYPELLGFLQCNQDDQQFRRKLAAKAFQHVASYDSAVSEWLRAEADCWRYKLQLCFSFTLQLLNEKLAYMLMK